MWWWLLTLSLTMHVLGGSEAEAALSPLETTVAPTTTPAPVGPTGWIRFHSSWYKLFTERVNYTTAAKQCRKDKADLAIVNNRNEHNFIEDQLTDNTYIGLDDLAKEGTFTWQDGSPMDFNRFARYQPDNEAGQQHCVEMRQEYNYMWNDIACGTANQYICEIGQSAFTKSTQKLVH